MAKIKAIYEEHKHRYGYHRITAELRRRGLLVNHKKVQRLLNKLKLFGIVSKRWHKYSSYRGTQGPIQPDLIKRSFSAVYPNHKWYSDITKFKLKGQKTYLSPRSLLGVPKRLFPILFPVVLILSGPWTC